METSFIWISDLNPFILIGIDQQKILSVLLLSNADKRDIKIKGFASSAWNLHAEIQGRRYSIAPSNFVARAYLDDFVIKSGHSKALAIGINCDMVVKTKERCTMKFFASYVDGEINIDTVSGEVPVKRSE